MKRLGLMLAIVAVTPSSSQGDGYCRSSYRQTYSYYTPSYSYTPTYAASYDYTPVYVKAVKAYVSPDYYSSVSDYYRDRLLVDAVAGKTAEVLKTQLEFNNLKQEVEYLRRQLNYNGQPQQQQAPPQQQPQQQQPQQEQPPAQPRQQAMPKASGAGHPVPEGLQAIVQASCIRCHGANNATAGGGLDFQNLGALPAPVRLSMKAAVDDGYMPKGGKPLDDKAAALFHQYATGRSGTSTAQK